MKAALTSLVFGACFGVRGNNPLAPLEGCWVTNLQWPDTMGLFLDERGAPGPVVTHPQHPLLNEWLLVHGVDSVRVKLGYGGLYDGTTIVAAARGDSLVGSSLPFTDEVGGPEPQVQSFVARKVKCPEGWRGTGPDG